MRRPPTPSDPSVPSRSRRLRRLRASLLLSFSFSHLPSASSNVALNVETIRSSGAKASASAASTQQQKVLRRVRAPEWVSAAAHRLFPPSDPYDYSNALRQTSSSSAALYSGAPAGGYAGGAAARLARLPMVLAGGSAAGGRRGPGEGARFEHVDHTGRRYECAYYEAARVGGEDAEFASIFEPFAVNEIDREEEAEAEAEEKEKTAEVPEGVTQEMVEAQLEKIRPANYDEDGVVDDMGEDAEYYCGVYHKGWWSYEWCHSRSVKQFHMSVIESDVDEDVGEVGGADVSLVVEDIISLGDFYDRKIQFEEPRPETPDVPHIVVTDYFTGGDDTNCQDDGRSTEVTMSCTPACNGSHKNGGSTTGVPEVDEFLKSFDDMHALDGKPGAEEDKEDDVAKITNDSDEGAQHDAAASILSIVEDQTCHYQIEVCTPMLCPDQFQVEAKVRKGKKSLRGIIERSLLGTMCMQKQVGWWKYEFCYKKHTRQFHASARKDVKTGQTAIYNDAEYILGTYDRSLDAYPDEEEVLHLHNNTVSDEVEVFEEGLTAAFVQEFQGGTVCDDAEVTESASGEEGTVQRATTVRFVCGQTYQFLEVKEDRTCHYVFEISVPDLCNHPLFRSPEIATQVVKCAPLPPGLDEKGKGAV